MPNPQRALRQLLDDWRSSGVTHAPRPSPTSDDIEPPPMRKSADSSRLRNTEPAASAIPPGPGGPEKPPGPSGRVAALRELASRVACCTRCPELAATRTQTVFGVGNPEARVMFIGEAPGADEDAQGEPFVGRAGQLLNRIIAACGWQREDIYICNILRCRPPGNRTPSAEEAAHCREYLDGQIHLVGPEYIVCWGTCAAQNLIGRLEPIGKLRGEFFTHGTAKVLCTYHPSYLLRNPAAKKPVWDDMLLLLAEMGLEPPARSE